MFEKFLEMRPETIVIVSALAVLAIVGAILIFRRKENGKWSPKELVMGAMCIAVAFVLSFIKLWQMPQGGSLTLVSMLPIMLFAFVYGAPKGALVGLAYGLLQLLQDAFVVHWAQLAMDYIFAFTLLCLAGLFQKRMWLGAIVAGTARYVMHVLSGVIFFAEYAGTTNVWIYSLGYNAVVMIETALIVIVVLTPPFKKLVASLKKA